MFYPFSVFLSLRAPHSDIGAGNGEKILFRELYLEGLMEEKERTRQDLQSHMGLCTQPGRRAFTRIERAAIS